MGHLLQHAAPGRQLAAQTALQLIADPAAQHHLPDDRHPLGLLQRRGHGVRVGPHQPARPQFDAPKVAHHRGQHAFELLVTQHIQHWPAGRTTGLAIVHRRRLPAGQQRPAYVHRPRMQILQSCHLGIGLRAATHRHHPPQKAAFLYDQLRLHRPGQRRPFRTHRSCSRFCIVPPISQLSDSLFHRPPVSLSQNQTFGNQQKDLAKKRPCFAVHNRPCHATIILFLNPNRTNPCVFSLRPPPPPCC